MSEAGLTHGGFDKHFDSKDALIESALGAAFADIVALVEEADTFASYQELFLSPAHVENPSRGCPVAALGQEVARGAATLKATFGGGLERIVAAVALRLRGSPTARRKAAIRQMCALVGAVVVARATDPQTAARCWRPAARVAPTRPRRCQKRPPPPPRQEAAYERCGTRQSARYGAARVDRRSRSLRGPALYPRRVSSDADAARPRRANEPRAGALPARSIANLVQYVAKRFPHKTARVVSSSAWATDIETFLMDINPRRSTRESPGARGDISFDFYRS